jgi:molybdopterin molybdotransferase
MPMGDVRMCGFASRTRVSDALAILEARVGRLHHELAPIERAAGRVAAGDVVSRVAVPHFARSMMDGYAVIAESTFGASELAPRPLKLVGERRAGPQAASDALAVRVGEAVRITTGAPLPTGANAVLMAELAIAINETSIHATAAVSPRKHVGAIGEDVAVGDVVVREGRRLRPQDAGVLASVGVNEVCVVRRPGVAIVITGDELLAPGSVPRGPQIVDCNSIVLAALVERDGGLVTRIDRIADGAEPLRRVLAAALAEGADLVLLSGGSSVGPEDHAPHVLAELGDIAVHGVAMRPSSPAGFGFVDNRAVFLLPGNPVSCMCAYEFFAGPTIRALGGLPRDWPHRRRRASLAQKLVSQLGRTDYARVRFDQTGRVVPLMISGASILSSTTEADGVVIVADDHEGFGEGEEIEVLLYDP